jgi:hypothetical protein
MIMMGSSCRTAGIGHQHHADIRTHGLAALILQPHSLADTSLPSLYNSAANLQLRLGKADAGPSCMLSYAPHGPVVSGQVLAVG